MRINLSSVLILTAVFVACGGTGDNFGDGGDEGGGGFGGSDGAGGSGGFGGTGGSFGGSGGSNGSSFDGSSGEDVTTHTDGSTGSCSSTCTSDSFCQKACGTTSTYCCDVPTGACYPTSASTCPKTVDASTDTSMY